MHLGVEFSFHQANEKLYSVALLPKKGYKEARQGKKLCTVLNNQQLNPISSEMKLSMGTFRNNSYFVMLNKVQCLRKIIPVIDMPSNHFHRKIHKEHAAAKS